MQTNDRERFYAISAPVPTPFDNKGKTVVVSYPHTLSNAAGAPV